MFLVIVDSSFILPVKLPFYYSHNAHASQNVNKLSPTVTAERRQPPSTNVIPVFCNLRGVNL